MPGMTGEKPAEKEDGPPVPEVTYTLEELKKVPAGVEKSRLEEWLNPSEFEGALGISRSAYFKLAPWQRGRFKKNAGL